MQRLLQRLRADEAGATAIEYGLIASLVSVAIIVVLGTLGVNLMAQFQEVVDALVAAGS